MPTKKKATEESEATKAADVAKVAKAKKPADKEAAPKKRVAKKIVAVPEEQELAEEVASQQAKGGSFISTVGRRKTSIARVRLVKNGKGMITINGRKMDQYFTTYDLREQVTAPLKVTGQETSVDVSAKVTGGGMRGQSEAVRHAVSRALVELNPTFRKTLKKLGYLTRDARKKERKKFGLKSARRAPQWSKR